MFEDSKNLEKNAMERNVKDIKESMEKASKEGEHKVFIEEEKINDEIIQALKAKNYTVTLQDNSDIIGMSNYYEIKWR